MWTLPVLIQNSGLGILALRYDIHFVIPSMFSLPKLHFIIKDIWFWSIHLWLWSLINISAKINVWRTAQSTECLYENLTWELYLIIHSTVLYYVFSNVLLQPSLPYFPVSVGSRIPIPCIIVMNDGGPIHLNDTNLHSAIWYYRSIMDD